MNKSRNETWPRTVAKWAALGAAVGGLVGVWLMLPGVMQGHWASSAKLMAIVVVIGAGLGAAVGGAYTRGRRLFWLGVMELGVILVIVALGTRDLRAGGIVLIAGGVLAVAFGLWVLLAGALHTWRTRKLGK